MLNIERVLKRKGMTQKDLASLLGVSVQAVNSAVCGRSVMSERLKKKYAAVLNVDVKDLYDDLL